MKQQRIIATAAILNTFHDLPTPAPDAKSITALVRHRGRVVGYRLSDGSMLDKRAGVALAQRGGIRGVGVGLRRGEPYLKALPDGSDGNNLGSLPSVPPDSGFFEGRM